ncbi:hypothetical protein HN789_05825 [archaeon]|jgi:hypothetical protein|nr:hypothetical protein [archaeon]MBT4022292.1 hypothetical protein [archaeon]MBT4271751.1 hypothetical protein [archaeon]MBT4461395.1 hypothetical protein [archaeon]MBT4858651.1 hypothetical protein [archaeon]
MRYYKEVRFCKLCKARYVVEQKQPKSYYCAKCVEKFKAQKRKEYEAEDKAEQEAKDKAEQEAKEEAKKETKKETKKDK